MGDLEVVLGAFAAVGWIAFIASIILAFKSMKQTDEAIELIRHWRNRCLGIKSDNGG